MNLVITKPLKCNPVIKAVRVLMIKNVQKLPHVFLSIYLKIVGFFFQWCICLHWEIQIHWTWFFLIPKKAIFLVSPLLFIITFYYFHDDVIIVMSVAGYLRFPFSAELFFNTYYDGCLLQCRINCAVNDIGMKWNR